MQESFVIPYPKTDSGKKQWSKQYGLNAYYAGKHWSKRKEDAEFWHRLVWVEMCKQDVRRKPFENPVVITYYWNDRLDCSNHAVMAKMIEDAMRGRVIHDDSRRWVKGNEHYFHDKPYIGVVITEI